MTALRSTRFRALFTATSLLAVMAVTAAHAEALADGDVKEVVVIGKRVIKGSAGATGLDLSLRETPQSVTIVTAAHIRDFALTDANQLLATIPGINVEAVETDRTYYNARGFDITNFQVDGVGQPLIWGIQFGALDTAIFDRIEAIRGANGMMTGTGNPSATINYIRKRPTKTFQASVSAAYGSWDDKRLTADISGPLDKEGTVSGRFVYANTDEDSWLDYNHTNRNVYYGVLSWDITPKINLTGGYSQQDNLSDGVLWGALPLEYSDGSLVDYDVSATTSAPWTYWDTHDKTIFGELSYAFDNGWSAKVIATHKTFEEQAKLLYAYNNPDPVTGLGVAGMSGIYPSRYTQSMIDAMASGPFSLFGREHEAVIGFNTSASHGLEWENFSLDDIQYPAIQDWASSYPAEPTYPGADLAADQEDKLQRLYGAVHLNLTDRLKGIVGFNAIDLKSTGFSYGTDQSRSEQAVSPYFGAVYDVTQNVSIYASYTDIFNPQVEIDATAHKLPAAKGKSYEAGLKSEWFDKRLYATASIFKSEQYDLADYAGMFTTDPTDQDYNPLLAGKSYYAGIDTFVEGYEFEIAGKITPVWSVNGGWTDLTIKDADGNNVRSYTPRKTLKLSTEYRIPQWRDLKLGAALRWQDDISMVDLVEVAQKAYSVLDLMASIKVTDRVRASLNVKNATDEKYLASLMWNQAFYAAPSSVMVTLDWTY